MSNKKNNNQSITRLSQKIVATILLISFLMISFSANLQAADDKSKSNLKKTSNSRQVSSEIKLAEFKAEKFLNTTKVSWQTSFESGTLGFKIWRESDGKKQLVNDEMIAGSVLQVGNGLLPAGNKYSFEDRTDSAQSFYWLQVINLNAENLWFGPVFAQTVNESADLTKDSETVSEVNERPNGYRQQIENVEFKTKESKNQRLENIQQPEASLLPQDSNALKIKVRTNGIYKLDAQTLAYYGFNNGASANWKLFMGGVEQPLTVNPDGSVEFYGRGIDTIQTDTNIYWITTDSTNGQRINRVPETFQTGAQNYWTRMTAERKDKTLRVSSILNGDRENWFGAVIENTGANQTLNLNDIATESGETATLSVDLQGITNAPHQVAVVLNGVPVGQFSFNTYERKQWSAPVALSALLEGTNTVNLRAIGDSTDYSITESVRINYPRRLKARNDRLELNLPAGKTVKLTGFTNSQVRVWDVSNPTQMTELMPESRIESDGTYTVTVSSAAAARYLIAQSQTQPLLAPTSMIKNFPSDLKSTQNGANFVIIAQHEFFKVTRSLKNERDSEGIQTQLVDVEDIYDEFNNGVISAEAIRSFLQYAKQNWTVKPNYALLVGDASVDPRNYSGLGGDSVNIIPTMFTDTWNMETVTDEMMADFDGDSVGEIAIGRLPGKNFSEIEQMREKILTHKPISLSEASQRGVFFVSDAPIGYDFAAGSRNIASLIPASVAKSYIDRGTQDPEAVRSQIINSFNVTNAAVVNYFGHASVGFWSGSAVFINEDAQVLRNGKRPALILMLACLNGDFAETNVESLAEAMMKASYGGAFAVWAASGWNIADDQEIMGKEYYRRVFTGMRLGDAIHDTKMLFPLHDLRRTYIFFGDPTQRLITP